MRNHEEINRVIECLEEYAESGYGKMTREQYDTIMLSINEIKEYLDNKKEFNDMSTDARCLYVDTVDRITKY